MPYLNFNDKELRLDNLEIPFPRAFASFSPMLFVLHSDPIIIRQKSFLSIIFTILDLII